MTDLNITCVRTSIHHQFVCSDGNKYVEFEHPLTPQVTMFWVYLALYCFLVLFAGRIVIKKYTVKSSNKRPGRLFNFLRF